MRAIAVVVLALVAAGLTACGTGGDPGGRSAPDGTQAGRDDPAPAAVRGAVAAYLDGLTTQGSPAAACAHLTAAVQQRIEREVKRPTCAAAVPRYFAQVGRRLRDRLRHVRIRRVDVRGASAAAVLVDPRAPTRVNHRLPLVRRGSEWLVDEAWAGYAPRQDAFEGCVEGGRQTLRLGRQGAFWRRQPKGAVAEFARRYCDAAERRGWLSGSAGFIGPQVAELSSQIAREMAGQGLIDAPDPDTPVI